MEIKLDGKYESSLYGTSSQVLTVTRRNKNYPVLVEFTTGTFRMYTLDGLGTARDRLTEVGEFKEGDKVMTTNDYDYNWRPRYFSHKEGDAYHCFWEGRTEWSAGEGGTTKWKYCRKPTPEELGEVK